jgi:GcrA cell cycle regulator
MFELQPKNLARTISTWTEGRIALLKDMWATGISASRIAHDLGGVSRNSVIGKVHRLGLSGRAKTIKHPDDRKPRIHRVQRFREVMPMAIENTGAAPLSLSSIAVGEGDPSVTPDCCRPGSHSCTLMELTPSTCRWPLWNDAQPERLYCGAPGADLENKVSYCKHHSAIAYTGRRG